MRKLYFLLCLMLTSVVGFSQLINEPFDYVASNTFGITNQSGGVWQVLNTGADSILVTPGSLSYPGLAASTGNKVSFDGQGVDAFRQLASNQTNTVYVSFLINVSALGSLSTTGGYFMGLTPGTTSGTIGASVWTRKATTGYNIGVNSRTTTANTFWHPTELALNTTYLVVVAYNFGPAAGDDYATIWLNPASLGGAAPAPDGTAVPSAGDLANIGRVQLRQPGAASEAPFLNIDELRLGLDWASVTPSSAGTPTLTTTSLTAFGNVCSNTTAGPNSFTLTGSSLTAADVTVGPLTGYTFSTTSGGTYTASLTLTPAAGALNQEVFVKFTPTAAQPYSGSIPVSGGGATATSVSASGTGIAPSLPTVGTAAASSITSTGATLNGTIPATGCSNITGYGFIISTTNGFDPLTTGFPIGSTNLSGTAFSAPTQTLNPSTTYYYVSFATNSTGTAYSTQAQFTTPALPAPSAPVATAATNITGNSFTANWDAATGTVTGYFLDVYTQGPGTVTGGTIAGWGIPTADDAGRIANKGNANNINIQTLTAVNGGTPTYTYPGAPASSGSTFTVSTTGWDAGVDTKYWTIDVNTTGVSNVTLSSLQASSNTGPKDWKIQYRIGNSGAWTDVTTVTVATSTSVSPVTYYGPSNLDMPADVDNQPLVQIRWVVATTTSVNNSTVASGGTSRITGIYVKGDYPGTVNTYVLQNQSVGNVTSYNVTGLSPNTNYYYVVRADNGGSTSANSNEISVTTTAAAAPSLSAGTLTAFGSNCINTTAGPNSFSVTGANLTGNVTVGALAGYTYSTTSGGTYTSTLTLTPTAGALNETIYVKFTPTAAQVYGGMISLSGGGATTVLVPASGTGVNTTPSLTTGASSAVTTTTATVAGTINGIGCSAVTAYGFEYSTVNNFAPGTGTTVAASNLAGGAFSVSLSGLTPNTTYYYIAYATNAGGTGYGTQMSFTTTAAPAMSATTLADFGNVCVGSTGGPNNFTITGTNLTGNVTVNSLAGFTYSTTSGGVYTSTLTLSPTSGNLSQTVYVKFTPLAIQNYDGDIILSGGGATSVLVHAAAAGINTGAVVTTGTATGVTTSGATLPGTVVAGCSATTAYGMIYSTTSGFNPATTGTTVAGSNLSGGNFTVTINGLASNTTYYYVAYATNSAGTTYGTQQSFTTASIPATLSAGTLTAFGNRCINTTSAANSFTVTGANLTGDVTVGALAGYAYSATSGGTYTSTLTLTPTAGALNTSVFVKFTPTAVQSYNGNITLTGGGASAVNVAASGAGINTAPGINTDAPSAVTSNSATTQGEIFSTGCSAVTAYGVIYSTTNGFNPATTGTNVAGTNLSGGIFTVGLSGLTPSTAYYYVAYATNGGGTTYGTQQTFTTTGAIAIPAAPVATAATSITSTGFTANWNAVAGATGYFLDVYTLSGGTQTIAGWDIAVNTAATTATANQGNASNNGVQQLTVNGGPVLATTNVTGPSGTSGTPNPYAMSATGWDAGVDTKFWQISVNTTGATGLTLASQQAGSNTGPKDFKIQYRVGNSGAWIDVPAGTVTIATSTSVTPVTWYGPTNLALPAAAENQPLVQIRWVVTSTTSINNATVAAAGTNRISGIYVKAAGGAPTPVYVTGYQNLNVNNVTSYNVTGLTPNTTYYYVVRATNSAGTSGNSNEITVTTLAGAALSANTLTAFGNTCINTTPAANSFTITGTNLAAGNVTVGPLAGFAFSTTSGGTYSPSLTIPTTGGAFSQQVFVQFTPTAVQSYSGNIPVAGGGASAINVAASGSGVNTATTVAAGAATGISASGATVPGTITAGCAATTAYGVIYSTTSGFDPATTGTNVAGTNLVAGAFSVPLSGLAAATTYYYVTYATSSNGTVYSTQQSFVTSAAGSAPAAPVATAATNVTATGFTANWNAVPGATGYFLDVYTLGAGSGSSVIAGWDMATNTSVAAASTANQGNASNINIQQLTTNSGGTLSTPSGYSGTSGTPNPYAVSSNGWNGGSGTKFWQIDVNTTGATGLSLSFNQGGSATGPKDWKVQYRVGAGGTWTDVPGGTVTLPAAVTSPGTTATWAVVTDLPIPTDAENKPQVSIRWLMNSDIAINGSTPVASGGTDRLSGIYVKSASGAPTPAYVAGYQNLNVNNVTSYNVTGLTPNTTYYYVVRATNAAGTSPNSNQISTTTLIAPVLSAGTLTAFGNICPNTTSTANSFTITGSALQAGNVTVGPLAGFAFSTTSGGTYTPTLTIPTTGGALSQQVFVQFTPTAVQSYSGNIPVSGAGATAINVAASGAGANNAPTVTAGAATAVTNITATLPGTISNNGCTAITAYGVEYSTTNGFANGSGTQAPASNLAGGAFSSNLSGLTASTTYYYHTFATNAGGTSYSAQGSFTTAAGPIVSLTASSLASFGNVCVNTVSAPGSFTITGANLTAGNITVAAVNGYQFATTAAGPYSPSLSLTQTGGTYSQTVFVQFLPTAATAYNGGIQVSGGGAPSTIIVNATGTGIVTPPTPVTLDSTNITFNQVSLRGAVLANGCSALTEVGIEWSTIANFAQGTGQTMAAPGFPTGASYLVTLSNLVPGTTYYYRAYARNAGATGYGALKSVTLPGLVAGLQFWPNPIMAGQSFQLTLTGLAPGYHGIVLYNSAGAQVYRRNLYIQANYITERITFPASLSAGTYLLRVVNNNGTDASRMIVIGR